MVLGTSKLLFRAIPKVYKLFSFSFFFMCSSLCRLYDGYIGEYVMYGESYQSGGLPPVSVGDEIDVRIEAVGEKGDGIARKRGFVLFIPKTRAGDEVRIRITKVLQKVGFAEVIGKSQGNPETSSPARTESAPLPLPVAEPSPEDSEDFGEELEEDSSVEEVPEAETEMPEAPDAPEAEEKKKE